MLSYLFIIYSVIKSNLSTCSFIHKFHNKYASVSVFLLVGSGTAGSLIAHRIATETNYTFIVLEAGGKGSALFDIPVLGPLLHGSVYDWLYQSVPQDNSCLAMRDNVSIV